ncbi:hypothetical protein CY35_07G010700 [Sphagnum magellanicum]|uniref:Uncharacterized protein n=1 Tax=Sphagnum magellanicum TaxID=128215 RepID=A0ACB8HIV3_9BRYO|nr:hypothetical protein CY35_07G010700 [Sphagnum magellanicum]
MIMESNQGGAGGRLPELNHLLQHTLRSLCTDSQWVYAVFWRILPRNYPPPQWDSESEAMDRSKGNKRNWIMAWEDGYCNFAACAEAAQQEAARITTTGKVSQFFNGAAAAGAAGSILDDVSETHQPVMNPDLFFKMSHEVYNYGEGLMGKVAADNGVKWVYREPLEQESTFLSPWAISSLDPHPRPWEAQFKAGIQTIAVVAVEEGVMQLGSTNKITKDLNFAAQLQRKFGFLQSIPGVFVPHSFFNSTTTGSIRKRGMQSSSVVTHAVLQQEGSSPPNSSAGSELPRGQWMMSSSCTRSTTLQEHRFPSSSHLASSSIDQFLQQSSRIGSSTDRWSRSCTPSASSCLISAARPVLLSHDQPQLQQTSSSSILGVKRPSDGSEVQASEPASKNLYASFDQISRNSYPRVDTSTTPSESRSPPDHQALNISTTNVAAAPARCAGGSSTSPQLGSALGRHHHQLEPSMSSLEALLSKLPSVTPMTDHQPDNGSCSSADQQLCCSMSIDAAPEATCKPPHLLYAASGTSTSMFDAGSANNTPNASTTPGGAGSVDHDHHLQHITAAADVQQASRSSSAAAAAAADHEENLNCSFMENFDTLSDLAAIPDTSSLDNNDSDYTSFLNQIY